MCTSNSIVLNGRKMAAVPLVSTNDLRSSSVEAFVTE